MITPVQYGCLVACLLFVGCQPTESVAPPTISAPVKPPESLVSTKSPATISKRFATAVDFPEQPAIQFDDLHADLGVEFQFDTGANGRALMPESLGGGGGWIDFDRDGSPDLYLVQGGNPTEQPCHPIGDRLFRNVSQRFVDVTASTRRMDREHGQGLAVGDFDNDGFDDLLVTNVGPDVLMRNLGDGTFEDVTSLAGVADPRWGSSAAWADLDLDGDLDLFVCNYLQYDVFHPKDCHFDDGRPAVCHPDHLDPEDNACYENLGDGTFREVTKAWGLLAPGSKSLGVVVADFNGDFRPDVYVANDTTANHLFMNLGEGQFVEQAVELGCAMNGIGQYQASMGIACGDYDRNGFLDLYVSHFSSDSNTLYANLGPVGFHDVTQSEGLHKPTLPYLGFGTVMRDFNADGQEELLVTNGHIDDWRYKNELYAMPPQLFTCRDGRWHEQSRQAGEYFQGNYLGRAVSVADYDRDGDDDLLIVHQDHPAAILQNNSPRQHWLQLEFIGKQSNRRGVNAIVELHQGSRTWHYQMVAGTSFCAAHQPMVSIGLGDNAADCEISVRWPVPGSPVQRVNTAVDRTVVIQELDRE